MTVFRGADRSIAYQVLANDLRQELHDGQFAEGRRLPTEAELSARYGVSRQTVRRALQDLVAEGLVFRVAGRGTFATPGRSGTPYLRSFGSIEDVLMLSVDTILETIAPLEHKVDIGAASRLLQPRDDVMYAVFRRLHRDVPFCVSQVYLPMEIGRAIAAGGKLPAAGETNGLTLIELVEEASREPVVGAQQSITACVTPEPLAALIGREPSDPVLRIDRLYIDGAGKPVELAIGYFNPDRYSYRVQLGQASADGSGRRTRSARG